MPVGAGWGGRNDQTRYETSHYNIVDAGHNALGVHRRIMAMGVYTMIRDILLYLALGLALGATVALFMVSGEDVQSIQSMDYTRAMKVVGWLIR